MGAGALVACPAEADRLQLRLKRAEALLASSVHMAAGQIADMRCTDPSWVRKAIHELGDRGMAGLRPRYGGGRPRPDFEA